MRQVHSAIRIASAVCAICALAWLVDTVNTRGNELQGDLSSALRSSSFRFEPSRLRRDDRLPAGLDLIDMYECMCGPLSSDIELRQWVGLWLVTALIGGLPTAVLIRARRRDDAAA